MNILVTIAARGGSKGVPDKNIRELCGKPLIAHTIAQALRWGKARRVVVSTDSERIAAVAREAGAAAPFMRPAELASDKAAKTPVIQHALRRSEEHFSETYDYVIDLDATSPLRKLADIDNALQTALDRRADVVFSVVPAHRNPYFNMVEVDAAGIARLSKEPGRPIHCRQDAPAVYDMNASIYVYRSELLRPAVPAGLFGPRTYVSVMDAGSALDIDSEHDFKLVEFLIKEGSWKFDYD